jgi:hypothetical protein
MIRLRTNIHSRRDAMFGGACVMLVAVLPAGDASADSACYDPDELSDGEQGMRQSLAYTNSAADRNQSCRACTYFKTSGQAGCGECLILNGSIAADGHCDSWTPKSEQR